MAKQVPWDEQTDMLIDGLGETIQEKYNLNLRSLLINPNKYLSKKGILDIVKGIRVDAGSYFSQLLDGLKDEQQKLETELESADSQYKQVDSMIANKAAVARIPYIKPLFISRNTDTEEVVIIDQYSDTLDLFIGKLVNGSSYVADTSAIYKQYHLGSWLFSGMKNYVLTINPPVSPVLTIENSKEVIDNILSDLENRASG